MAASVHQELRRWTSERLHTAVYSHGHIDHVFGAAVWEAESADRGWPAPEVIAHEALPLRFDRYILTARYNQVINRRQFGVPHLRWPVEYRYPDRTYSGELDVVVGGLSFLLRHEKGETDDHTVTWLADKRVLCSRLSHFWAAGRLLRGDPGRVGRSRHAGRSGSKIRDLGWDRRKHRRCLSPPLPREPADASVAESTCIPAECPDDGAPVFHRAGVHHVLRPGRRPGRAGPAPYRGGHAAGRVPAAGLAA